jgi:hypothetical protein
LVLIWPNEAPATEVKTDEGTWQVQPATGETVSMPSPTLVGAPAPSPLPPSAPTTPP